MKKYTNGDGSNEDDRLPPDDFFKLLKAVVQGGRLAKLDRATATLWMILMSYRNSKSGLAWPSRELLMKLCGTNSRGLSKALAALESNGLLRREVSSGGRGRHTVYTLLRPRQTGAPVAPVSEEGNRCHQGPKPVPPRSETGAAKGTKPVPHGAPPSTRRTKKEKSKATTRRMHASFEDGREGDVDVERDETTTTLKTWGVDERAIKHALRMRDSAWLADLAQRCQEVDEENARRGGTIDLAAYAAKRCWHPELFNPSEAPAPSSNRKSMRGLTAEQREREQERRELNEVLPGYGDLIVRRN